MGKERSITPQPPADFTPNMGEYTPLKPFRYWCQKVLPTIYDDSLSYYELLTKVLRYLNETMKNMDTLHEDMVALREAYIQLQSWVNTYFDSLDVQEEINNKLDDYFSKGILQKIITDYISEYSTPVFVNTEQMMLDKSHIYVLTTNGYIYQWNGSSFENTGLQYVFGENPFHSLRHPFNDPNTEGYTFKSVDEQPYNLSVTYGPVITADSKYGVFPEEARGKNATVLCYSGHNGATTSVQICTWYSDERKRTMCAVRFKVLVTWKEWSDLSDYKSIRPLDNVLTVANKDILGIPNVESFPNNSVITCSAEYVTDPTTGGFPPECKDVATVLTYAGTPNLTNAIVQICTWRFKSINKTAIRYKLDTGWLAWVECGGVVPFNTVLTNENKNNLGILSVDTFPVNSVITCSASYTANVQNGVFPIGCSGAATIMTYAGTHSLQNSIVQICTWQFRNTNKTAIRFKLDTGWGGWCECAGISPFNTIITANNYSSLGINGVDNQPLNSVITYANTFIELFKEQFPKEADVSTVICFAGTYNLTNSICQICTTFKGDTTKAYIRFKITTGWLNWEEITDNQFYKDKLKGYYLGHQMIYRSKKAGSIFYAYGDSITATVDTEKLKNWFNLVVDHFGGTIYNKYAVNGAGFTSATNNILTQLKNNLPEIGNATIFIQAGINDRASDLSTVQNSVTEVCEYLKNNGYYNDSLIVFIGPIINSVKQYEQKVLQIASIIKNTVTYYGFSYIDGMEIGIVPNTVDAYPYITYEYPGTSDGVHPNWLGQTMIAGCVIHQIADQVN